MPLPSLAHQKHPARCSMSCPLPYVVLEVKNRRRWNPKMEGLQVSKSSQFKRLLMSRTTVNVKYILTVWRGWELEVSLPAAGITLIHHTWHHYLKAEASLITEWPGSQSSQEWNCWRLTLLGNARATESFSWAGFQGVKGILHQRRILSVGHLSSTSDTPAGPCFRRE